MSSITTAIIQDLKNLTEDQKVIPFEDLKQSEHLLERLATEQEDEELKTLLEEMDPGFIVYMNMIECLMIIASIIRKHERLEDFNRKVAAAEKKFTPGTWGSSVTESFFNMWVLFDLPIEQNMSLAKLCMDVANSVSSIKSTLNVLIEQAMLSRIGIYQVRDHDENHVYLQELITEKEITAICPTGYNGLPEEIWLVRLFPPVDNGSTSIVVTTPYSICNVDKEDWINYFAEQGIRSETLQVEGVMDRFIRKTSETDYWLNYIHSTPPSLETEECIHLSGIPKE